ncbi:hypothetical protein NliqN6_0905 [Naganishia liquefaciens]|uniref:Protein CPL1-like domain-containing protein n=1 Tax=Naganishia liquefaciens TaxID=104408 RepID=A0A8H3YCT1_9TREE|nr:hypothetical protein NliqN6_0905 [Naganishia liquefaciens]
MEDLSACGNCPSLGGQDCTLLPGVAFGGVTCDRGSCIAVECLEEEGYELVNSTCLLRGSQSEVTDSMSTPPTSSAIPALQTAIPNEPRYALTPRSAAVIHISHRFQARIDPDVRVTIYLQYSGIDLTPPETDNEDSLRMMDASATKAKNFESMLERIRKMDNVRVVEADKT